MGSSPESAWDSIKGFVMVIVLLLVLGLSLANFFSPKTPAIPEATIASLQKSADQFSEAAGAIVKGTQAMNELNRTLSLQLATRKLADDKGYDEALKKWGVPTGDANAVIGDFSLFNQTNYIGGGSLPPGEGGTDKDPSNKDSGTVSKDTTNGSDSGAAKSKSSNAPGQAKQSYYLPDRERLHRQASFSTGEGKLLHSHPSYAYQYNTGARQDGAHSVRGTTYSGGIDWNSQYPDRQSVFT